MRWELGARGIGGIKGATGRERVRVEVKMVEGVRASAPLLAVGGRSSGLPV